MFSLVNNKCGFESGLEKCDWSINNFTRIKYGSNDTSVPNQDEKFGGMLLFHIHCFLNIELSQMNELELFLVKNLISNLKTVILL